MKSKPNKNYFDIRAIISKGISDVREYELPAGTVLYRPLSDLELDEAQAIMLDSIKDSKTKEFMFNSAEDKSLDKINEIISEEDKIEEDVKSELPSDINYSELVQSMIKFRLRVAYLALSDFTENFNENDLKKIRGIPAFVDEVIRVSGNSEETIEEIENFR